MSRETEQLEAALDFCRQRSSIITAHLIKARSPSIALSTRQRHLEEAIAQARAVVDELVTKQTAVGWRRGNAA